MRARDVMTSPVISVQPQTPVKYAAMLLAAHAFTALPVISDGGELVGIVTEADIVRGRFPRDPRYRYLQGDTPRPNPPATVEAVMTSPVVTVAANIDLVDMVRTMLDQHLRCLPVVDQPGLVGIVTRRDLVRVLARDDDAIASDVRHRLACYGGPDRWRVRVHDGVVEVQDCFDNHTDCHVATVLSESVQGVIGVHATGPDEAKPAERDSQ